MVDEKRLYFIPIIAHALNSENPRQALKEAFDEIKALGTRSEFQEGFQQFLNFVQETVKFSGTEPDQQIPLLQEAIYRLIYDLATGRFEDDEDQKKVLLQTIKSNPEWESEYDRIKTEARAFLPPDTSMEIELLVDKELIGSFPMSAGTNYISSIQSGSYEIRFSNGRIIWEGNLTREDLIWSQAFPEKSLPMAAESEFVEQRPTKAISLLNGELSLYVYAGLESGEIKIEIGDKSR